MNFKKLFFPIVIFFITVSLSAQQTIIHTNPLKEYNHAMELYQNKAFVAAQEKFNNIKYSFDNASELKANCEFYAANCAVRLGQPDADRLMEDFVDKYPTSTKRNSAFINVANYYFKSGKYAYAAKWYSKVNTTNLTLKKEEDYNFNYAYSLFVNKSYAKAKEHFLSLLDSPTYGSQAKYYYGYIAYNLDDYDTADQYLGEVANESNYKSKVSYYLADMNFKLGKFDKAITNGLPLLEKAKGVEHSEISKIVGESYFNLKKYDDALPHLKNYKGKRGKWNNTDYYLLGYTYYKQNNFESAVSNFNKIIGGSNAVAQNAYYHLAECYLKLNQKTEALNAFRNAAHMKFEPEIKKDAWLNYAKLSYEIGNPYKSVPDVLQEYLDLYPNSTHKKEINDLIISAYISSSDFKGALDFLKNKKGSKERELYQKVAFYRGVELFNKGKFSAANESFKNSLTVALDATTTARATFWKGETNYRLNNFLDAQNDFKSFEAHPNASQTEEYTNFNYNLGYANFKLKEYPNAIDNFKKFTSKNSEDAIRINDSYLRIGDGYFASRNYSNAIEYYNKAISSNGVDKDYAQFQKAISYGLTGNESKKIDELNSFLNKHSKSAYRDDAFYVLGNSYTKKGNNNKALQNFNNLINSFKRSPLVSKAMLKKGLIYYNTDKNEQALTTYKAVVKKFPNTAEAKQAVKNTRQIYVDLGRVDEYAAWVKNIDFVNVSDAELDNDMYESAEKQYLQNNHKKSITSFRKYLSSFPNGLHKLQANFYLAQSLFSEKKQNEAATYYTFVVDAPQSEFSENALSRLSEIYLENKNWQKAIPLLERLELESNIPQNKTFAQSNLMKGYYANENYTKAVNYADKVLANNKIENRIKSDAHIIIARSAIKTNKLEKAKTAYKEVEKIASGELKAEALYYSAYFENNDGSYRVSNQIIQNLVANYAPYKYWGAKGLIVMANNHYELKDAFQATYILESVIENFAEFKDVVDEATLELNRIKTEQAKTNESIKQ
ncbi:Tetratricopeptide repeat-containing protein [Lutibacter oricola]|uniref:Tetratricopeptide repeat-containing protein n=1 Tax=Lutibacter oricola TaxID=762486 RepID=A0A1H2YWV2_9FLAO|nr:tetratricopeptide repeat protein [Lutibacter oricola]SDX09049.1 Tetratricopeptide repeat-containing protein [Lutibacter oricola]